MIQVRLLNPLKEKQVMTNKRSNCLMSNFEQDELWTKPVLSIKRQQSEMNKVGVTALAKGILIYGTYSRGICRKVYFSAGKAICKQFQRCTSVSAMPIFELHFWFSTHFSNSLTLVITREIPAMPLYNVSLCDNICVGIILLFYST